MNGSGYFYAVAPLSLGDMVFPMLFDRTRAATKRTDESEWLVETENSSFDLTLTSSNTLFL